MISIFTSITYQDWLAAEDRLELALDAVRLYRGSAEFRLALEADAYFRGENPTVARKTVLRLRRLETRDSAGRRRSTTRLQDVVGNRIGSMFLYHFVTQQVQFLLGSGCMLENEALKARLGTDFDQQLAYLGECALLHGVSYLFWNGDHAEVIEAARDANSGFVGLADEMTGTIRAGIQFWQISPRKPLYLRLFEEDGVSLWRYANDTFTPVEDRRPYLRVTRTDALGCEVTREGNYSRLPVIPLYGNPTRRSELTPAIRAKIDAYDTILSDFADNLERANDVYWVLNNFGGTMDDVAEALEQIQRLKAVATLTDGTGQSATAEPHTIQVPYEAREAALRILRRSLYEDYMAMDMQELTGSDLTNVAIRTAAANLNLKADRFEWQVFRCVRSLLGLLGVDTDIIRFQRQEIGNASETIADIASMRPDIDRRTALRLNPYIQPDEVEGLMEVAPQGVEESAGA